MSFWWAMRDSNSRHPRCKRGALPTELIALSRCRTSVRRVGGRDLCVTGENRKSVRAIFSNFLSRAGAPVMKPVDKLGGDERQLSRHAAHCRSLRWARIYIKEGEPRGGERVLTFGACFHRRPNPSEKTCCGPKNVPSRICFQSRLTPQSEPLS